MSKFQIEKVENRHMTESDNFLMVNYYPVSDKLTHFAFISSNSVNDAKSNFTVGQWRFKNLKTN